VKRLKLISKVSFQSGRRNRIEPTSLPLLPPQPPNPLSPRCFICCDQSAVAMGLRARLARAKLASLTRRSTASWTTDSEHLLWAEFSFHVRRDHPSKPMHKNGQSWTLCALTGNPEYVDGELLASFSAIVSRMEQRSPSFVCTIKVCGVSRIRMAIYL